MSHLDVATFTVHFYMNENKKIGMLLCEVTQVILFHYYIIFKKYYIILQCILLVLFYLYTYLMLLKPCSLLCSGLYISVWETSVQLSPIELFMQIAYLRHFDYHYDPLSASGMVCSC